MTKKSFNKNFIKNLPKAELHLHIEGTMEPEEFLLFAQRNNINIPYKTVEQAKQAYKFSDFKTFIDAYTLVSQVLKTEQDFYDLTLAYLKKISQQGVLHTEIFFDLQTYMQRNMASEIVINGIHNALVDGYKLFNISSGMIMCFMRNFSQESAFEALEQAIIHKDKIIGVGLAALEIGNPATPFEPVFAKAHSLGFHTVAHAGESDLINIRHAVQFLGVERIDHGIQCMHDPELVKELASKKIPLTVCPLSNVALNLIKNIKEHPLKKMFDAGLMVTINSDDPAFFDGYIAENYYAAFEQIGLSYDDLITCARNSFIASFASKERKKECLKILQDYISASRNCI